MVAHRERAQHEAAGRVAVSRQLTTIDVGRARTPSFPLDGVTPPGRQRAHGSVSADALSGFFLGPVELGAGPIGRFVRRVPVRGFDGANDARPGPIS